MREGERETRRKGDRKRVREGKGEREKKERRKEGERVCLLGTITEKKCITILRTT